jgi:class 3 adenylate cyclase
VTLRSAPVRPAPPAPEAAPPPPPAPPPTPAPPPVESPVVPQEAEPPRAAPADDPLAVDDELRPITALFADVVGSTSLGEHLAPHEVKSLIGECVNRMSRAVEEYGGAVQAYMGDGIAAFFGMPTAHEDDPERAAHAALRIIDVVAGYERDISAAWGVDDFNVRVGINSGQAAVGVVGAADRQLVALGDTTNVAARLQAAAAPGNIVVGEATARRLAHRFVLESLGELSVKGRGEPVSAWRLAGTLETAGPHAPTPLVGREQEVARLRRTVDELLNGRGQLLLLVGESGIGKTRLQSELETIVGDRALWLHGEARSFGSELLYWPFAEVLRRWLGAEQGEAEIAIRTKLRSKLASLPGLNTDTAMTRLGALLGLQTATRAGPPPRPEDLARDIRAGFGEWLEALSARRPVIICIDDLHWIDAPTRELATSLLELTDRAPILLTFAFRADPPSEATRFRLHALEHYAHRTTEIALEPLDAESARELVAMLMPDGLESSAGDEIVARAEGNPLYVEELLRSLVEEGGLERRRRTWALTRTPARNVPPALEGLLMARIDHLPDQARRLAQVAAVIGRTFPARVLERVAPTDHFDRDVSILLRAQVIRELHRYPELVYSFKHGLLKDCALSTLTPVRSQELYGAVAAVFEELYEGAADEYLDVLASYYARSNNRQKALEYLELAGRRAASLNANAQAVSLLNRASKVASELNDPAAEERLAHELARLSGAEVGVP